MNAAMYCTTDCRRVDVPRTDRERPTSGRRGGSGGRVRPLQLQLRHCCLGARSFARLPARPPARSPARTQALFQHRPPSASLSTRPLAPSSLSPTLLCTPLAEGGRKRKGGWNERKRLAPLASPFIRGHRKHEQVGEGREGRGCYREFGCHAQPPLPPLRTGASSSASTMEGGRAQQGCLPFFRRPPRLPRPKPRRARIPRSDSPKVFGRGRTRADAGARLLLLSIVTASSFHLPPTLSPPHSV